MKRIFGVLCLLMALQVRAAETPTAAESCNTRDETLEKVIARQAVDYRSLLGMRGVPNRAGLAQTALRDVGLWSKQRPASAMVLIGQNDAGDICAWVWQGNVRSAHVLSRGRSAIAAVPEDLRRMNLAGRSARAIVDTAPLKNVTETLSMWRHQWLPRDFVERLGAVGEIVLLPSGALAQLPWNALMIEALAGRQQGFSLVVAADFESALSTRLKWSPVGARDKVLVVGNPDYAGRLAQLPGAEAEARFYGKTYGVEPLLGLEATVPRVRKALEEADVAFLATHGFSDPAEPLEGGAIALAGGRLEARTIQRMQLERQPLIVLSACETGLGQVHEAGTIGLARAFQLAGASGVVMSLWSVDDQATRLLMEYFVDELRRASPSLALVRAQLRLKKTHPDPRHWGAFSYFGTPLGEP